jgi:DNA-binding IclR family transcriptional regulator
MAFRVAEVLEILSDGNWHMLEEVRRKMNLNRNQIQQIAGFLKEYEFVALDETQKRMRIEETVRKFLTQEATL